MAVKEELHQLLIEAGNVLIPGALDHLGIDAICLNEVGGLPVYTTLEYRVDPAAMSSGNILLVTQVREKSGSIGPGWFRRSIAQVLVFYFPQNKYVCFVDCLQLRECLFTFGRTLKQSTWIEKPDGTAGRGILLPAALLTEWALVTGNGHELKRPKV